MQINVKKLHKDAKIPTYSHSTDGAVDLTATTREWNEELQCVVFGTGLAIEIPEGHVGLIFPRSSICKVPLSLSNSVGVIDAGFSGEIRFFFRKIGYPNKSYEVGDRIGQLIVLPYPKIEFTEVTEFATSERGMNGFGSTGK